jgi:hypothetical protein
MPACLSVASATTIARVFSLWGNTSSSFVMLFFLVCCLDNVGMYGNAGFTTSHRYY